MKKMIINVGGIILFYLLIIGGILLLNQRFSYINNNELFNNYVSIKQWFNISLFYFLKNIIIII